MKKTNLPDILKTLTTVLNASASAVFMLDSTSKKLKLMASSGNTPVKKMSISFKQNTLEAKVIKNGKAKAVTHPGKNTRIKSLICIPLIAEDYTKGVFKLYYDRVYKPGSKTLDTITSLSKEITLFLENTYLREKTAIYTNMANIDGLTGLYNHKYFQEALTGEMSKAKRFKYPVTLLMLDIDNFKKYNDTYGHPAGDLVLQKLSNIIKRILRSYDIFARYGGEEFTIILPHTIKHSAALLANRIRKEISRYPFNSERNKNTQITISIGIAEYPMNARIKNELIERADQALYLAKEEGRNRVCSSLITSKGTIKLAFCPPVADNFFGMVLKGIREVAEDIGNIDIVVSPLKKESIKEQSRIINKTIDSQIDALAVCCKTGPLIERITEKANRAGKPLIFFQTLGLKKRLSRKVVSSIGYDHREAGRKVGTFLSRILRSKGEIAIIEGIPGQFDNIERKKGFLEIINEYPEIHIVASEPANWLKDTARKVVDRIIKKYPELDAIFAENDEMALGAFNAIKTKQKQNRVFIVGIDGSQNAIKSIARGELTATLNTNPIEMGRIITRTFVRSTIEDEKINKVIHSPINMISQETVDKYI